MNLPLPRTTPAPLPDALSTALPAGTSAHLRAEDVRVVRGGREILRGATETVHARSRLAIVGENGRGKTTLLHVLARTLRPDDGSVTRAGTFGIAQQTLASGPGETVGTLVGEAIGPSLAALDALDASAESLARGEAGAEDEYAAALETATLLDAWDAERRVDLALSGLHAVTDWSRPLAVVTHDRALLRDVAEEFLDLDPSEDGRPVLYAGGYEGWQSSRKAAHARWVQDFESHGAEHRRLAAAADAARDRLESGWRPEEGHGRHQRQSRAPVVVQAMKRRQADLEAHRITVPVPPLRLAFPRLLVRAGQPLLHCLEVTVSGRLDTAVDVRLAGGERLLVTGPNGAGKSTLLGVLAGVIASDSGEMRTLSGARISLLGQEPPPWPARMLAHELYRSHTHRLLAAGTHRDEDLVPLSSTGLLDADALRTPLGAMSAGQQSRLHLALRLAERPDVLLLDEPSNHLSAPLVDELTEALLGTPAAVVVATHDRQMLRDLGGWPRLELGGLPVRPGERPRRR